MTHEDALPGADRFPPTRRSVIEAARSIDAEERERALEALDRKSTRLNSSHVD